MTGLHVYILIRTHSSYLDFKLSVARSSQWKCEIAGGAMADAARRDVAMWGLPGQRRNYLQE